MRPIQLSSAVSRSEEIFDVVDPERQIVHLGVGVSAKSSRRLYGQANLEHELRQAQKLESVGRLAVGVAHQIHTPIQFGNGSVRFLQTAEVP
jgi:hypothetical protein